MTASSRIRTGKIDMNDAEIRCREYLREKGMEGRIIDFKNTDITAESTALALDVDVDRICKGLAFKGKGGTAVVVIASGKTRVNNGKFRNVFGFRPTMIPAEPTSRICYRRSEADGGQCF